MSGAPSHEFEAWADQARAAKVIDVCLDRYKGLSLKKSSEGFAGGCPKCGGEDRFGIHLKNNVWNCRGCGVGGDAIALVMNVEGLNFIDAVTEITGEPPPGRDNGPAKEMIEDPVQRERREERRDQAIRKESEEERRQRKVREDVRALWDAAKPFAKSGAERYIKGRGIVLTPEQADDLRFMPQLTYRGFADPTAEAQTDLGSYPAMIAAFRDVDGNIIGVHRTYIDPKTFAKLHPPGDDKRNAAKKMFGQKMGGLIRLGPIAETLAIGEGIETTASWYAMGIGPEDVGIAASGDLGNLSGKSLGTIRHPKFPNRMIPDDNPDLESLAMVLPPQVRHVILLGDGDSDGPWTRMKIAVAVRRIQAQGRHVSVCFADDGDDFNGMLRRQAA